MYYDFEAWSWGILVMEDDLDEHWKHYAHRSDEGWNSS